MREPSCRPLAGSGFSVRYHSHRLQAVVFTRSGGNCCVSYVSARTDLEDDPYPTPRGRPPARLDTHFTVKEYLFYYSVSSEELRLAAIIPGRMRLA